MALYEIQVGVDRTQAPNFNLTIQRGVEFNTRTNCTAALFVSWLAPFDAGPFKKIAIMAEKRMTKHLDPSVDVLIVRRDFDFQNYWERDDKKRMILETICEDMALCASKNNWDLNCVRHTCRTLMQSSLKYVFAVGKPKTSRNRKWRATLMCEYEELYVRVFAKVENAETNQVVEIDLAKEGKTYWSNFSHLLGRLRWLDNHRLALTPKESRSGLDAIVVSLPS